MILEPGSTIPLHAIIPAAGRGTRLGAGSDPKSLLPVAGEPILLRTLRTLAARGVANATLVLGFAGDRIQERVGGEVGGLRIHYAWNRDFDTTEHGYSLYCARESWAATPGDVLLLDADNVFDPALLDRLLAHPAPDRVLVDPGPVAANREEELVLGRDGRVTGFVRARAGDVTGYVGDFVGMNHFSTAYVQALFAFMETLFASEGRGFKYERVLHRLLAGHGASPAYLDCAGLGWVNVNRRDDLERARRLARAGSGIHGASLGT